MGEQLTWTCLAGLEDLPLPQGGQALGRLVSASGNPTAKNSSSSIGPVSPSMETSGTSTAPNTEECPLFPVDFPANHFLKPGSNEARRMTVTSGRKCSGLLGRQDPVGCLVRTLLESSTWHSTKCLLTWRPKATPRGRLLFQLAPLTPRTDGTEFGLLPTPLANEGHGGKGVWKLTDVIAGKKYLHPWESQKLWPTPAASEARLGYQDRSREVIDNMGGRSATPGQLNPEFVEWLMGYPIGHTALKDSATQSSPKLPTP